MLLKVFSLLLALGFASAGFFGDFPVGGSLFCFDDDECTDSNKPYCVNWGCAADKPDPTCFGGCGDGTCVNGVCVCDAGWKVPEGGTSCMELILCDSFHDDGINNVTLENGYCKLPTNGFHPGSMVRFKCYSGYRLEGNDRTTCVQQGDQAIWLPSPANLPTCVPITCEKIGSFPDGVVTPSSAETQDQPFKTKLCFTCDDNEPPLSTNPDGKPCMKCKKDSTDTGYWSPSSPPDCNPCRISEAEVVVLLDESGSVNSADFTREKNFAMEMATQLRLDNGLMRMGVMAFQSYPRLITHVDNAATSSVAGMHSAITAISQNAGGTNIASAIDFVRINMLNSGHVRTGIPRYMIVVSDGYSYPAPGSAAAFARSVGITMFAVGVGNGVNAAQMQSIPSQPSFYFFVNNFNQLQTTAKAITDVVCRNAAAGAN